MLTGQGTLVTVPILSEYVLGEACCRRDTALVCPRRRDGAALQRPRCAGHSQGRPHQVAGMNQRLGSAFTSTGSTSISSYLRDPNPRASPYSTTL